MLKIVDVKEIKGDSSLCTRRAKKIVTYDYYIKVGWVCYVSDEQ